MNLLQEVCETKKRYCYYIHIFQAFLLWLAFTFQVAQFQDTTYSIAVICNLQKNCSDCIRIAPECAWCKAEIYEEYNYFRCDLFTNLEKDCPPGDIVFPKSVVQVLEPTPLDESGGSEESLNQLTPENLIIKIRPNAPVRFQVQFRQTKNYPMDLYYLMDVSESMRDDMKTLADIGHLLGNTMKNITKNFKIGYGSFVDKKVMPYADMRTKYLENPCLALNEQCVASYGFRNNMALNANFSKFVDEVQLTNISANLDNPECALDAMLQAIICQNEIGWRNQSRKIVLLATDSEFHTAGDGKLGGLVLPNDGLCHLDSSGEYTESITQDYPSISQVVKAVRDYDINVIFAANVDLLSFYDHLKDFIPGSKIAELASDSSNIVELIENQYQEIAARVELVEDPSEFFSVNYYTNCSSSDGEFINHNQCSDVKMGDTVYFEVEIIANSCPNDRNQVLHISPVGLGDKLTVELELICDCDCEKTPFEVENSSKCSKIGTYKCGICNCLGKAFGDYCECDAESALSLNQSRCQRPGSSVVCSGRGVCECEKCSCFEIRGKRVYGDLCECDDFSCPYYDGELCGGSEHGSCICGSCRCRSNFKGEDCGCKNSTADCLGDNKLCSDIGECVCGKCQCPLMYGGALCQDYLDLEGVCNKSSECLSCNATKGRENSQFECENCVIEMVDNLGDLQAGMSQCVYIDEDKCRVFFHILTNSSDNFTTSVHLRVSKHRQCVLEANLNIIIPIIVAIVVGIGLLALLCWKLVTMIHDNREYARFDKLLREAKWEREDNPVYVDAVRNYVNPTFGQDKFD